MSDREKLLADAKPIIQTAKQMAEVIIACNDLNQATRQIAEHQSHGLKEIHGAEPTYFVETIRKAADVWLGRYETQFEWRDDPKPESTTYTE